MNQDNSSKMEPQDYTLTPSGPLGSLTSVGQIEGHCLGEYRNVEKALEAVCDHMANQQFWPNIWWVSDHGNYWPIDSKGNEIRQ